MRHVFATMGTTASLDLPGCDQAGPPAAVVEAVTRVSAEYDTRFSLYRPDSELSRIATGALSLPESSPSMRDAYASALDWRAATNGAFTPHRPDGVIDLNGIVKALAMSRAAEVIRAAGILDGCLNVGGDVLVSGVQADGSPWVIGIVDPAERTELLCALDLGSGRGAVATSGSAERGEHIWRRGPGAGTEYAQVTVVAADIVTADVLATAIVSGGELMRDQATAVWPIDVLTVTHDGALSITPALRTSLRAPARTSIRNDAMTSRDSTSSTTDGVALHAQVASRSRGRDHPVGAVLSLSKGRACRDPR